MKKFILAMLFALALCANVHASDESKRVISPSLGIERVKKLLDLYGGLHGCKLACEIETSANTDFNPEGETETVKLWIQKNFQNQHHQELFNIYLTSLSKGFIDCEKDSLSYKKDSFTSMCERITHDFESIELAP